MQSKVQITAVVLSCLLFLSDGVPTAYEAIQAYGFPIGIVPIGVTHYDLDETTGKFNAYMNASCSFSLEGSYQLKYSSVISGFIRQNKLTDLSGVKVKVLFIWLSIVEVRRNADKLELPLLILGLIISLYARKVAVDWIAMLWILFLRFKPRFLLEKYPLIRRC
ncbi:uncharacterized protein LOC121780970 [Salvia splendens]|uniref:uncharacterized protein LOC121780970 n=1 Tax=Salvia splendens TaxID=180675 RepID=UPI001C26E709|nr:uncharacterized protein LOC121780970 [Salvia splendens]